MALDDVFTDDFETGDPITTNWTRTGFGNPVVSSGVGRGGGYGVECAGPSTSQSGRIKNTTAFTPGTRTGVAQWDLWLPSTGLTSIGSSFWFDVTNPSGVGHILGLLIDGASAPYDLTTEGYTGSGTVYSGAVTGGAWFTLRVEWVLSTTTSSTDGELRIWLGTDENSLSLLHSETGLNFSDPDWAYASFVCDRNGFLDNVKMGTGVGLFVFADRFESAWRGPEVVHESGDLTANALIVGRGGDDVAALASLGTTTTVLHGNASGDPTFGAVSLSADVSGTLPIAHGGTGQTAKTAAFDALAPNTTKGDLVVHDGTNNVRKAVGSDGQVLTADAASTGGVKWAAAGGGSSTRAITFAIDGGGVALTTGIKADVSVPFACTITKVRMLADQSGSVVVDIWKDTYANYPPTVADTITASAKPTLSSATKSEDATLTGWTTSVAAGDTLRFNLDSVATITRLVLVLTVTV